MSGTRAPPGPVLGMEREVGGVEDGSWGTRVQGEAGSHAQGLRRKRLGEVKGIVHLGLNAGFLKFQKQAFPEPALLSWAARDGFLGCGKAPPMKKLRPVPLLLQ